MLARYENIVWLQTAFLGDCVLTTAAIRLARKQFPEVRQFVLTHAVGEKVFAQCPEVEGVFVIKKRTEWLWQTLARLGQFLRCHRLKGDPRTVMLLPHKSTRSALIAWAAGFSTIAYEEGARFPWLRWVAVPRVAVLHEAARIALLLEPLGVDRTQVIAARPGLDVSARIQSTPPHMIYTIGLALGSVWATKAWPLHYFAQLAVSILDMHPRVQLSLLGSIAEKQREESFLEYFCQYDGSGRAAERLVSRVGKTSIGQMSAEIKALDLLISNDSAPVHFASAFDVPTVVLFGATIPEMGFGPLSSKHEVCQVRELSCRPCGLHGHQTCPQKHFRCMRELTPAMVFETVAKVFKQLCLEK
ncbi:MAG: glycosyltransferase family 9 protein [Zetaproteobacteria bacterium]|nr:glycosyltransferase family 9 protein [Zetaproteobacteria bacterium]